jgi:FixJ family two-component response regulator/class 3 adenylate cyclase
MKPVLVYVDDEAHNLTVFEAAMPSDWEIHIFDSPLAALDRMNNLEPWVVVTDQRMPGMVGVNFLEIVKKIHPHAKRVLVTGYSDEDLIIDSIRKAGVHDYIRKPWDVDDLEHRISQMVNTYSLEREISIKTKVLEEKNAELMKLMNEIEGAKQSEMQLRKELEAWSPPFLLQMLKERDSAGGTVGHWNRDLAMIAFDIVDSSKVHDLSAEGHAVRNSIIRSFSESVIKHGGWRESLSGDSAYAHFGMMEGNSVPAESALAVAYEFRTFLRNLSIKHNITVECGISLHFAKDVQVHLHSAEFETARGRVMQKSLDTSSLEVSLLHRIEKLTHKLPGSNIIMTEEFVKSMGPIHGVTPIGAFLLKGHAEPRTLFLKRSDLTTEAQIAAFVAEYGMKVAA